MATSINVCLAPFIKKMDSEIEKYITDNKQIPEFETIYSLPCFNLDDAEWKNNMHSIYNELTIKYNTNYEFREYQQQYINTAISNLNSSKSIVLHAPTGSGKTFIIMNIIEKLYEKVILALKKQQNNIIILFVSPLLDINDQCVADKYINIIGKCLDICKINSRHGFEIDTTTINKNIIISTTYISLNKVLDILNHHNKHASFAIFDECHMITNNIQTIIFNSKILHNIIYVSATPLNVQQTKLEYGEYIRLINEKDLMNQGYLAKLNTYIAKPLDASDNLSIVHAINMFIEHTKSRYICCFVNSKKNGVQLSTLFEKYKYDTKIYLYFSGDNSKILDDFTNDISNKSIIISCKKICMGVDIPCIDSIIFVDNKMSLTDISQCIGRGLRSYTLPSGENKKCSLLLFEGNNNNNILQYLKYMHKTCGYDITYNSKKDKIKPIIETQSVNISSISDYNGTLSLSITLYNEYNVDNLDNIYNKYKNMDMTIFNVDMSVINSKKQISLNGVLKPFAAQMLIVNVSNTKTHKNFINSVIHRLYIKQYGIWGFNNTPRLKQIYDKLNNLDYVLMFDSTYMYLFTIYYKNIDTSQNLSYELWSDDWKSANLHIHLNIIKVTKINKPRLTLNKTLDYSYNYNWQGPSISADKTKLNNILKLFNTT